MTEERETTIWRYMDLARYYGLLHDGLFFTRPSFLAKMDSWEGAGSVDEFQPFLDRQRMRGLRNDEIVKNWETRRRREARVLDGYGVSCWHRAYSESSALWQIYVAAGLGIAVRSTKDRVIRSLGDNAARVEAVDVEYLDGDSFRGAGRVRGRLSRKRHAFSFERELRFILRYSTDDRISIAFGGGLEQMGDVYRLGKTGVELSMGRRRYQNGESVSTLAGCYLPADPVTLIRDVVLAPGVSAATINAVIGMTQNSRASGTQILRSALDVKPPDAAEITPHFRRRHP
ncbi:MAG: hypothetical protein JWO56_2009 [Acidobacteria bacterium]|nr:hypothetical protein [Acidobacteriota bacterium]